MFNFQRKSSYTLIFIFMTALFVLIFCGCIDGQTVAEGDSVTMDFEVKYKGGDVFDSTKVRGPVTFIVGDGVIPKSVEKKIMGLKSGDKKTFELLAQEAYPYDPSLIIEYPSDQFLSNGNLPEVGQIITLFNNGSVSVGKFISVDTEKSVIDFNVQGDKILEFNIEILSLTKKSKLTESPTSASQSDRQKGGFYYL